MNRTTIQTTQFIFVDKTEQIRIDVDDVGKVSYWYLVPEITDPEKRWQRLSTKDYRQLYNMFVKFLKIRHNIVDGLDEEADNGQIGMEL